MNTYRYIIARLFLSFGLHRKTKRLMEATDEMHLLHQAEEILGEDVWDRVEDVEALSVEYWNLRKSKMYIAKLKDSIQEAGNHLDTSHEKRHEILDQTNKECQALEAQRVEYTKKSDALILERDRAIVEARQVKRKFEASRTKIEVLTLEGGKEDVIAREHEVIASFKEEFKKLKKDRDAVGEKIQKINEKIRSVDDALGHDRKRLRDEASVAYQSIGRANRDMSKLSAEVGIAEIEMRGFFQKIGNYVSQNVGLDPICSEISRDYGNLIAQMQNLRSSIALNHKLVSIEDGYTKGHRDNGK